MSARSKLLFAGNVVIPAGGGVGIYTVPAGKVTIVKDLRVVMVTGAGGQVRIRVVPPAGSNYEEWSPNPLAATALWHPLDRAEANLPAGYTLQLRSATAITVSVWASGAELEA